jgi:hypothetical protein
MPAPIKTFCCYAREDKSFLEKLKSCLAPFRQTGLISIWADCDITAGTEWKKEVHQHLNTDQMILLLISPSFMDSDYCYSVEMQRALERHRQGEARVIPIILRPVHWQDILGELQALPTDAKPVIDPRHWYAQDEAFFDVAKGIRKVIYELQSKQATVASIGEKSDQNGAYLDGSAIRNVEKGNQLVKGADDFIASLDNLPETAKTFLRRLSDWAISLEQARLVQLYTYHGKGGTLTLLPRLKIDDAGLVSIYNNHGTAYIQFWRSVFERRAPCALAAIEAATVPIKQGNTSYEASEELLAMLTEAYHEAVK